MSGGGVAPGWRAVALLAAAALALRCADFGNPVIHVDEQWYLLVGDRLRHGAIPYVDLWDRKPVGLFLLFAAMRMLPGDGVLAYQLAACACAAATAIVVAAAARRVGAAERGALAAGVAYLLGLTLLGGRGGQAPVFYNLPVALAALLTLALPSLSATGRRRTIVWRGAVACLLAGLAIQLKTSAAFEAAFVGLAQLIYLRLAGARAGGILAACGLWLVIGLAPTTAAFGWYAAHGWAGTWWFANVTSLLRRPGYPAEQLALRLLGIGVQLAPLALAAAVGRPDRPQRALTSGWLAAASIGFMSIGTWFDHYALPLLAPLAVAAAPTLGRSTRAMFATLGLMVTVAAGERIALHDDGPGARMVAAVVARESHGGCPYVFIGDTITYLLAHACTPTPYAFPNLLAYTTEQGATGIDEAAEVRRILAHRPPVIVTSDRRLAIWNRASLAAVKAALGRDYRLVRGEPRERWHTLIYVRRPDRARGA